MTGHRGTDRAEGAARPVLVVFDVNQTLSDMSSMATRFEEVGAPGHLAATWFSGVLRDGFALTTVGVNESFASIAAGSLRVALHGQPLTCGLGDAVQHVMEGFAALPVHPDVPAGLRAMAEGGLRLVTLSNGSASVAEELLDRAGIREHVEAVLSVEDAPAWKPAPASYAYALRRCAVASADAMLVAVHPWDIDGAGRAGLATAWVDRDGAPFPEHFRGPDTSVRSLTELADQLRG